MRLIVTALALLLIPASAAQASAPFDLTPRAKIAEATEMTSLPQLRRQAGLPEVKVNQDAGLSQLLDSYIEAAENLPEETPGPYDAPPDLAACSCYLYEVVGDGFRFTSPSQFAASQGRSGSYGAWVLGQYSLESFPEDLADELFLDSRLTDLASKTLSRPDGSQTTILFAKLSDAPVEITAKHASLDARKAVTLIFTSPINMTYFEISLRSGKQWMRKYRGWEPEGFFSNPGFAGMRVNYFGENSREDKKLILAWGSRYRITSGQLSGEFTTLNPTPSRKSFQFEKNVSRKHKKVILSAIRKMKPAYRAILKRIAPYTRIKTHPGSGSSMAFPYGATEGSTESLPFTVSFARGHLAMRKFKNEVVAHELGHIIDYAGLDYIAWRDFKNKFKKSKKWRNCSGHKPSTGAGNWPCSEDQELIADQLAFAALNKRSGVGGYGHPRLISSKAMLRMLTRYFAFNSPYDGRLLTSPDWKDMETPEEAKQREEGEAAAAGLPFRAAGRTSKPVAVDQFPGPGK